VSEARRSIPGLPSRYRGPAFRAVVDIAREDPVLQQYVKSWRVRDGSPEEFNPVTDGELPLIAISPVPRPMTVFSDQDMRLVLQIRFRVFVAGTNVDDLFAVWEAVEDAFVDNKPFRDTTVRAYLCGVIDPKLPAGIMRLHPEFPAFDDVDVARPPKSRSLQTGAGLLTCFLRRSSAKPQLP
jgi:hypothetical protein